MNRALTKMMILKDGDGLHINSVLKDLIIKIETLESEVGGVDKYSISVDAYDASEVSVDMYGRWKKTENITIVEVDSDEVNKALLELTGKKEKIKEFVEQTEEESEGWK